MTNSGWQLGNLSHVVMLSSNVFASIDILALKGFAHKRAATWQLGSCCHVVGCAFLKKDWQLEKWVGKSMLPCCRLCFC